MPASRHLPVLGLAAAALSILTAGTAVAGHAAFTDGPFGTHDAGVEYVVDNGITAGCGDGTRYCPADAVSRAQMATFLHRFSGNGSVAPNVNASTLDGLTAADVLSTTLVHEEAQIVDGIGEARCPAGTLGVDGGYLFDSAYLMIADVVTYDSETDQDVYLVGAWDPALGEGGTGTLTVTCAMPGDGPPESAESAQLRASGVRATTQRQALEDALARLSAGRD